IVMVPPRKCDGECVMQDTLFYRIVKWNKQKYTSISSFSLIFLLNPWVMAYLVQLYGQVVFLVGAMITFIVGLIGLYISKKLLK
ncbi:MAG: hypothetical protein Q7R96_00250, partial [Nanoarchaeota archaeon]|nr:hypothetical protein [Nanoarchaeota archaeon]